MRKFIKKYFYRLTLLREELLKSFLKNNLFFQKSLLGKLLKKYSSHFFILFGLVFLSFVSEILPMLGRESPKVPSLDSLVPKDFVLLSIEISNGKDIVGIIGGYGVVDLYAHSEQTGLPEKQAAEAIKILPPETEEGRFIALIPAKEVSYLFKYSEPFYAVIQNLEKTGAKIHRKKQKKSLIVIEENF